MQRPLVIFSILLGWLFLTGLGLGPSEDIPKPEISFTATVIDNQGTSTRTHQVTWDGKIFFVGNRGKGTVTIPFEKVKRVNFIEGGKKGDLVEVQVTLRDGEVIGVSFDSETTLYGATSFGTYRIPAKYIKEIVFE